MACRQLGYLGGHLHMTHGNSSIGDLRAALAAGDAAAAMEFDCAGEEGTLGACQWRNRPGNDCDPRAGAVGLVCQKPTYAVCPGVSEPHGDSCYDVYAHPDDRADFEAAQKVCQENGGGHLVQIEDQTESDFVSELLFREASDFEDDSPFWTGGIVNTAAGKTFMLWHSSRDQYAFL